MIPLDVTGWVPRRRGAVLLEVLVSMGLLIFGMAVVGLQIRSSLDVARDADIRTRAVMALDTKLAELSAGVLKPDTNNDEIKGDFGTAYAGYTWRIKVRPTEIQNFNMLTLEIGFNPAEVEAKIINPERELDIEDAEAKIIQTAYRLMPIPADVNLERDFGLSKEELDRISQAAGGAAGGGGAGAGGATEDSANTAMANAAAAAGAAAGAAGMDGAGGAPPNIADILASLGMLTDMQSFDPRMLADLPPEQFAQVADLLQQLLGRGGAGLSGPLSEDSLRAMMGGRGGRGRGRGGPDGGGMNDGGNADSGGDFGGRNDGQSGDGRNSNDGGGEGRRGNRGRNGNGDDRSGNNNTRNNDNDSSRDGRDSSDGRDGAGNDRDNRGGRDGNDRGGRSGRGRDDDSASNRDGDRNGNSSDDNNSNDGNENDSGSDRGGRRGSRTRNSRDNDASSSDNATDGDNNNGNTNPDDEESRGPRRSSRSRSNSR